MQTRRFIEEVPAGVMGDRMAIVFDGNKWHVRHIRVIEHDLEKDEKVYRCDRPISSGHKTLDEAVKSIKRTAPSMLSPTALAEGVRNHRRQRG